ncbi:cilium assembly protein DZIP1 isoform X2 [Brienomyrus brachyistius]|uniref:cilium assembly protein DZIP1 isoform X2 n=1 Tax=Brienomyrus brachyistius TaxID=42636 RepID=UPI0020B255E2|nr:cilium assembly protein DZIP1 isoform X2 [Brienomyrus brachyistius]
MPFFNNVYYPLQSETPGTQSSVGMSSLLNSPQSQPSSGAQCRVSATLGPPAMPVFKFRPRRESVDWRRISAIDVERVASELDFHTLQEQISSITFCNVEHERCPHCQGPMDPVLLKLFRLAQFTLEYLLHSQEYLTLSLQAAEDRLQASGLEREQLQRQLQKRADDIKSMKEELKQRKKIISSQQSMINAGMGSYHKCQHCDKAFMNYSFLQSHMQRRHPEEYDIKLLSENQKKVQSLKLQEEINKLREQLTLTRSQLETQQTYITKASQEQSQRSKEEEMLKTLERWKEEEKERQKMQMEEMRLMFLKEAKELSAKNALLQSQVSEMEESSQKMRVNILALQEEKVQLTGTFGEKHQQDVQKLQQQLKKQEDRWASRMQKLQDSHDKERNQLLDDVHRVRHSASGEEERNRKRMEELDWKLQEQRELIMSQREQMKKLTAPPPTRAAEQTVVSSVPEPKPKSQAHDQSASVHKLDPIEELSEEDKDSSISEKKAEMTRQSSISILRKNPNIKKELRPILEQTLAEKLEALGIQPANRLSNGELKNALAKVSSEREKREGRFPECRKVREDLFRSLSLRVKDRETEGDSAPEFRARSKPPVEESQMRARSSSLPSGVTRVVSKSAPRLHAAPLPAPRSKTGTLVKTSTLRTPPFSSDEDSEEDEEEEEAPQRRLQGPRAAVISVSGPLAAHVPPAGSDTDWTEGSDMEEIDPQRLQSYKQPAGREEKAAKSHIVKDLTKDLEKKLADREVKKPLGGVNVLPDKNNIVQELKSSKTDEDDDDDWDISSLEDKSPAPKLQDIPVKKSFDSTNTSVWGSSTGKTNKGQNDVDAPSTMKSSIVTVSDWSVSDAM